MPSENAYETSAGGYPVSAVHEMSTRLPAGQPRPLQSKPIRKKYRHMSECDSMGTVIRSLL